MAFSRLRYDRIKYIKVEYNDECFQSLLPAFAKRHCPGLSPTPAHQPEILAKMVCCKDGLERYSLSAKFFGHGRRGSERLLHLLRIVDPDKKFEAYRDAIRARFDEVVQDVGKTQTTQQLHKEIETLKNECQTHVKRIAEQGQKIEEQRALIRTLDESCGKGLRENDTLKATLDETKRALTQMKRRFATPVAAPPAKRPRVMSSGTFNFGSM